MALTNDDYTVGWISALPVEMAAARAMMDKPLHPQLPQAPQDTNSYSLGRIGPHNVVIACLPGMGTNAAAHAAANLLRSFPNIRLGFMVGVGGGVPGLITPGPTTDVRLGDVVVSSPGERHGGVIQYDFGTAIQDDQTKSFIRKGHLNKPPSILLGAIKNVQAGAKLEESRFLRHYDEMLEKYPIMAMEYFKPDRDRLFFSTYQHQAARVDCSMCSEQEAVLRQPRKDSIVHYGLIASGNRVLRDALERDRLSAEEGIICFEMEAAGLMDEFSCVVIRGICDYCDSHKSKQWQPYASAVAAAFAKELLLTIPTSAVVTLPHLIGLATIVKEQQEKLQHTNDAIRKIDARLDAAEDAAIFERHTKCLDNLKCIHPRYDKKRLEEAKGGLLRDAYKWILQNQEYIDWRTVRGLLWLKGDPGKGKTMLMCGVINELDDLSVYFFCQATVNTNNTSTWVLRGLIFSFLERHPDLSGSVHDKIQRAGDLPPDTAFYILSEVLEELLAAKDIILMIDALDECLEGLDQLLRFIVKASATYSSSWLVSSRNIIAIGEHLDESTRLSLELNDASVASAVDIFIEYKVQELSRAKKYDSPLRDMVLQYLLSKAQGTFLWVSLVCLSLAKVRLRHTRATLVQYPSGLDSVYQYMLESIEKSVDADVLTQVLTTACVVSRPLSLAELSTFIPISDDYQDATLWTEDLVNDCGCFFNIRESVVEFVHQSAKDFLVMQRANQMFPDGLIKPHHELFVQSVNSLQSLRRNMYSLTEPGIDINDVAVPKPDPLAKMKYAATYWIAHILESLTFPLQAGISATHATMISHFMKTKYLYWLEALSLLGEIYPAILAITELHSQLQLSRSQLGALLSSAFDEPLELTFDGLQFIRYFQYALIRFPLQVYISGLVFSPPQSLIKRYFIHEAPEWVVVKRGIRESWPTSLVLTESYVKFLKWSLNGKVLAVATDDQLTVWDAETGQVLASLAKKVKDCAFSLDGHTLLVTSGYDMKIDLWSFREARFVATVEMQSLNPRLSKGQLIDSDTGDSIKAFASGSEFSSSSSFDDDDQDYKNDVAESVMDMFLQECIFSNDSSLIASVELNSSIVNINNTTSGQLVQRLVLEHQIRGLAFSAENTLLAGVAEFGGVLKKGIHIWTVQSGTLFCSIPWHEHGGYPRLVFSPDSRTLAVVYPGATELWDLENLTLPYILSYTDFTLPMMERTVVFSRKNPSLFICRGYLVEEWSTLEPIRLRVCEIFPSLVSEIALSMDGQRLAAWGGKNVKIWHSSQEMPFSLSSEEHSRYVHIHAIRLVGDKVFVAEHEPDCQIRVWPALQHGIGTPILTSEEGVAPVSSFSHDGSQILAISRFCKFLEVWCLEDGNEKQTRISGFDKTQTVGWGPGEDEITVYDHGMRSLPCWSISKEQLITQLPLPTGTPEADMIWCSGLCWSPLKTHLAFLLASELYLWDAESHVWSLLASGPEVYFPHEIRGFAEDGSLYGHSTASKSLHVKYVQTRALVLSIPGHDHSSLFIIDDHWLKTDRAWYPRPSPDSSILDAETGMKPSEHLNIEAGFGKDPVWIRSGIDPIVWLPPVYRPLSGCWDIDEPRIALYTGDVDPLMVLEVYWERSKGLASQAPSASNQSRSEQHKQRQPASEEKYNRHRLQPWHRTR